jgi:hypothetical protein
VVLRIKCGRTVPIDEDNPAVSTPFHEDCLSVAVGFIDAATLELRMGTAEVMSLR